VEEESEPKRPTRQELLEKRTDAWMVEAVHEAGALGADLLGSSLDVDDAMLASMAALQAALAQEESTLAMTEAVAPVQRAEVAPALDVAPLAAGGAAALLSATALLGPNAGGLLAPAPALTQDATNWDELEARMAALASAIDGDASLQPMMQDAARMEARAARMREREAKREAKRLGLQPGPLLGGAAAALSSFSAAAPQAGAAAAGSSFYAQAVPEPSPLLSGATAAAAKMSMTHTAAIAAQRERERVAAEAAEAKAEQERREAKERARREAAAAEAASKAQAVREKAERERAAKAAKEAEKAAKRSAQVERENRETGSAPNLRRALASGDAAAFRVQVVACSDRCTIGTSRLPCMVADGAPDIVMNGLKLLLDDPEALCEAFAALGALAKADDRKRMKPFCERAVGAVRDAMAAHPHHARCQAAGHTSLSSLVVHVSEKADVGMAAMQAMAESPEDEELTVACCMAMRNAALGEDKNREEAAEFGALEALHEVMKLHSSSPRVCEQACWAVKNLCVLPASQPRFAAGGGLATVLTVLREHAKVPATCEQAIWALRILAFNPENAAAIQGAGGVTLVNDTAKVHIGHAGVQETCCGALRTFAALSSTRAELAESGAPVRAVAAMRRHAGSAAVQMAAVGLLSALSSDQDWQRRTVSAGAVEVLVEAVRAHPRATKLQIACFVVLVALAAANAETKARAASCGAVEAAVAVLDAQCKLGPEVAPALTEAALEALASVVSTPGAQRTAMEAEALKPILAVMRIHRNVADVAEKACRALSAIVWCLPPAQKAARKLGLLNDLMACINTFGGHRGVQKAARALMVNVQVDADDEADPGRAGGASRTAPGVASLSIRNPNARYTSL